MCEVGAVSEAGAAVGDPYAGENALRRDDPTLAGAQNKTFASLEKVRRLRSAQRCASE